MLPELDFDAIGKRVKKARLEKGYSQATLAEKLDCSNNYISHIETGQTKVSLKILAQISYVLGKPLDYFLLDTPYVTTDYMLRGEFQGLIEGCNRPTLQAVRRMMEIMVKYQRDMEKEYLG